LRPYVYCPEGNRGFTSISPEAIEALRLTQVAKPFVIAVNLLSDGVHTPVNQPGCAAREGFFISIRTTEDCEMPKLKTKRGAAKRFRATGTGKILRSKAFSNHILTKKTTKRKRNLRKSALVDSANRKSITRLVPYL